MGRCWIRFAVVLLAVAVSFPVAGRTSADTVTLTSGKVIEDVTVKDDGDKVRLTSTDGSSSVWPKSMIKSIVHAATTGDELDRKRKALAPNDANARVELARWCEEKKLAKVASKLYEEAISLDPSCEPAHRALGHVAFHGRWYLSLDALVSAEATASKDDVARLRELVSLCDESKAAEPKTLLRRILELAPDDEKAHQRLGHVLVDGKWEERPELELPSFVRELPPVRKGREKVSWGGLGEGEWASKSEGHDDGTWDNVWKRKNGTIARRDKHYANDAVSGSDLCGPDGKPEWSIRFEYNANGSWAEVWKRKDGTMARRDERYSNGALVSSDLYAPDGKTLILSRKGHWKEDGTCEIETLRPPPEDK